MGAPRLRPRLGGPVIDGPELAALLGIPVTEVYKRTQTGQLPAPINNGWTENPRRWRWSRQVMQRWVDGDLEVAS